VLTHAVAIYHLWWAVKKKQNFGKTKFVLSLLLLIISGALGWVYLKQAYEQLPRGS
jgi:hypothetical protein